MKTKIIKKHIEDQMQGFPCLLINDFGTVILATKFTDPGNGKYSLLTGTCVHAKSEFGSAVGDFSDRWDRGRFDVFNGSINLSNED